MALPPDLEHAYRLAHYVVFGAPDLVIRVGEPSAELDALLEADGVDSAAFLTAANPNGMLQSEAENEVSRLALHQVLADAGYSCYVGEGRDPSGAWPAEPSILAVGITRHEAEVIGRSYEQNALVFIGKGAAPELVAL